MPAVAAPVSQVKASPLYLPTTAGAKCGVETPGGGLASTAVSGTIIVNGKASVWFNGDKVQDGTEFGVA